MVMTGDGGLVEVQATAERTPLSRALLDELLSLAEGGIARLRGRAGRGRRRAARLTASRVEPAMILATRNEHKLRELREALPGIDLEPLPERGGAAAGGRRHLRRQRARQGAAAHDATGQGRDRRRLGDRGRRRSAGGRACARRATPARARATSRTCAKLLDEVGSAGDSAVAYVCALALVGDGGEEQRVRGPLRGRLVDPSPAARAASATTPPSCPTTPGPATSARWPSCRPARSTRSATAAELRRVLAQPPGGGMTEPKRDHQAGRRRRLDRLQRDR